MKKPMLFPSFVRRLKRQMTKHKMKLRPGSGYGIKVVDGIFKRERRGDRTVYACVIGIMAVGEHDPQNQASWERHKTVQRITSWSLDEVRSVERGFEGWDEDRPSPRSRLLPFYELGQKIRDTMGKAA